ncbi:MAG: spermidine/putrescine ABC transporter substrate-binding protein PotF, partial [Pseudomonas fluorescens]|nr:spermidine/putrescine ABC transporter substrate-binding protein PotF [Pseudomonas fluorescens]
MKYKQQQPWQKIDIGADSVSWRTARVGVGSLRAVLKALTMLTGPVLAAERVGTISQSCEKLIKHQLPRSLLATICSLGLLTA